VTSLKEAEVLCEFVRRGVPHGKFRSMPRPARYVRSYSKFADDMNMKLDCLLSFKDETDGLFVFFRSVKLFDDSSSSVAMKLWDSSLIRKYSAF
jgi:hypothetical protein